MVTVVTLRHEMSVSTRSMTAEETDVRLPEWHRQALTYSESTQRFCTRLADTVTSDMQVVA